MELKKRIIQSEIKYREDSLKEFCKKDIHMQIQFPEHKNGILIGQPVAQGYEKLKKEDEVASVSSGAVFAPSIAQGVPEKDVKAGLSAEDVMAKASVMDVENTKNLLTVVGASVSPEELSEIEKNGFHPGELKPEEMVTITDEIRATLAEAGVTIPGYNDDLSMEVLTEIAGSVSAANALAEAFRTYQVPQTEENAREAAQAVELGRSLSDLSTDAKLFLVENKLEPTIENLYTAQHSGYAKSALPQSKVPEELLKDTLVRFGYEGTEDNVLEAKSLLSSGIGLTKENFDALKELDAIDLPASQNDLYEMAARGLKDKGSAVSGDALNKEPLVEKAARLVVAANSISDSAILRTVEQEEPLTLKNLIKQEEVFSGEEPVLPEKALSAKRLLEEVRLSLTVSSTYTLYKLGIQVDTKELSSLVEDLKAVEEHKGQVLFGKEDAAEEYKLWQKTNQVAAAIPAFPEDTVGILGKSESQNAFSMLQFRGVSLATVAEEGAQLKEAYQKAGTRYETMMTSVRSDLGDSITKAFRNIPDLLSENGFAVNEENEKATRILSRNGMEITAENLEEVKEANRLMTRVIEKMTPAATLKLIREGENPLQLTLQELENKLDRMPEADYKERYARFLVRLEERNEISEAEKESYIGIYRLLHTVETKDSSALGAVLNKGEELSFKSLLRSVRSVRHAGMDVSLDDQTGILDTVITKESSITMQLESAFAEGGSSKQQQKETEIFAKEKMQELQEATSAVDEAVELLIENELPATIDNLAAAKHMTTKRGQNYRDLKELTRKAESQIPFDQLSEDIRNSMDEAEELKKAFEAFTNVMEDTIEGEMMHEASRVDLKALQAAFKEIHLAADLSKQEHYEVPMELGGELTSVSVHMKKGAAGAEISYETKDGGKVFASIRPKGEQLSLTIYGEKAEDLASLAEKEASFKEHFTEFSEVQFVEMAHKKLNSTSHLAENNIEGASKDGSEVTGKLLYQAAKAVLEVIAG